MQIALTIWRRFFTCSLEHAGPRGVAIPDIGEFLTHKSDIARFAGAGLLVGMNRRVDDGWTSDHFRRRADRAAC